MSIVLGNHDTGIDLNPFKERIKQTLKQEIGDFIQDDSSKDPRPIKPINEDDEGISIIELQRFLSQAGFFSGGNEDGIYGYRTRSAVRLFQHYVFANEGHQTLPDNLPDGIVKPTTIEHIRRWQDEDLRAGWEEDLATWERAQEIPEFLEGTEYFDWLTLLDKVKSKYQANPSPMLRLVNEYINLQGTDATDTIQVDNWEFNPDHIHLIGIRHKPGAEKHSFNDVMVLLIKGMVFKFQCSTDPGSSVGGNKPPFLVQGQHNYRFGWHKSKELALRPLDKGVLVIRSDDFKLTEEDVANGLDPKPNPTINIHWGGRGASRNVNRWSAGCQVITGSGYVNYRRDPIDCSAYAGVHSDDPFFPNSWNWETKKRTGPKRTRGAHDVLSDLIIGLSGDMISNVIKYTLLVEEDLDESPKVKAIYEQERKFGSKLR